MVRETARRLIKIWFLLLLPLLATFNKLNILPRGGGFAREREIKREKDRERERKREKDRERERDREGKSESSLSISFPVSPVVDNRPTYPA